MTNVEIKLDLNFDRVGLYWPTQEYSLVVSAIPSTRDESTIESAAEFRHICSQLNNSHLYHPSTKTHWKSASFINEGSPYESFIGVRDQEDVQYEGVRVADGVLLYRVVGVERSYVMSTRYGNHDFGLLQMLVNLTQATLGINHVIKSVALTHKAAGTTYTYSDDE